MSIFGQRPGRELWPVVLSHMYTWCEMLLALRMRDLFCPPSLFSNFRKSPPLRVFAAWKRGRRRGFFLWRISGVVVVVVDDKTLEKNSVTRRDRRRHIDYRFGKREAGSAHVGRVKMRRHLAFFLFLSATEYFPSRTIIQAGWVSSSSWFNIFTMG